MARTLHEANEEINRLIARLKRIEHERTIYPLDLIPPSVPTGLTATIITDLGVHITWTESTDPQGNPVHYRVYRDSVQVGSVEITSFVDNGLAPGTTYSFQVAAVDLAGNASAPSEALEVTTTGSPPDITPPSTPTNLGYSELGSSYVVLTWDASTDTGTGVARYQVYRNGVPLFSTGLLTYTDTGLTPQTTYTYTVAAIDGANNFSGQSAPVIVFTPEPSTPTYYVATSGDSTNPGTFDLPWSLDHALNGAAGGDIEPGDTIYIRGGTYQITATQVVTGFLGTETDRITIQAYPGERVTFRNAYSTAFDTFEIQDVQYTDFIDFEFSHYQYPRDSEVEGGYDMAHVYENPAETQAHIRWLSCRFHDAGGHAFVLSALSDDILIEGCLFYYNGSGTDTDWTIWDRSYAYAGGHTIRNNIFLHNAADDVRVYSEDTTHISSIDITGNFFLSSGSLLADPARAVLLAGTHAKPDDITVTDNVFINTATPDSDSAAIQVGGLGGSDTLDIPIATGSHDGVFRTDGSGGVTASLLTLGRSASGVYDSTFLHFVVVSIPQGATITASHITVRAENTLAGSVAHALIRAEPTMNPNGAPTDVTDAQTRARTTAAVAWDPVDWTTSADVNTPDISSVIQEVVDNPAWESGNAITIFIDENGGTSTNDIWFASYNHATDPEPVLHIEYAGDAGAGVVEITGNYFVGQPIDLSGTGYEDVTFEDNTIIYDGAHAGDTEADYPANDWIDDQPSSGVKAFCHALTHNSRQAILLVLNWSGAATAVIPATDLTGLNLAGGDTVQLANAENYYSDRIITIFNGSSLSIPMTGRTQASTIGGIGNPASLYPRVGVFAVTVAGGGGAPPPPDTTPPDVPTDLAAASAGTDSVSLSWSAPSGDPVGYTVYRNGSAIATTSATSYTDTGLAPGTTYTYTVSAYDAAGNHSDESDPDSATTDEIAVSGYFVSPTGSASAAGTLADPWSLAYALSSSADLDPGDIVYLRGGTYSLTGSRTVSHAGTAGNPIQFKAYPNEQPVISMSFYSGTMLNFTGSHLHFYRIVFTGTGYTRTSQVPDGTYEMALGGYTAAGEGIKFYGCHFYNSRTHGFRSYGQAGGAEFNACLFLFSGSSDQFDHNIYVRNLDDQQKTFKDCLIGHAASHGLHGWGGSNNQIREIDVLRCIFFNNGSLYNNDGRSILLGGGLRVEDCIVQDNITYSNITNSKSNALRLGMGGGSDGCTVDGNLFIGQPVYIESPYTNLTATANTLYYNSSQQGDTVAAMAAGSGNTLAAVPTSGTTIAVRAYDWDARQANLVIVNYAGSASVFVSHAQLTGGGLTIAAGDTYTLHNAENYFGDTITGTYDGTGITVPMTGRTIATPYGLPKPQSVFPRFGPWVIETRAG
jgi:chitodextrinase